MDQYTWKSWGDKYERIEPKFSPGGYNFWWKQKGPHERTIDGFSVTMHVKALKDAVHRCASGRDPYNSEWKKEISMYGRDSRIRFRTAFYNGYATGILRMSFLDLVVNEAILGLHILVINLNGQFTLDDGWVFYLLETRLGETSKQIYKDFPKEGLNSNEEGYKPIGNVEESLPEFGERLRQAREQAIEVINRIILSREPTQYFQIFDISDGSQVNDEDSQCLTYGDDREGSHEVILRASQSGPAGLGEGYISWTASKGTSHLVGFSAWPRGKNVSGFPNVIGSTEPE